MTERNYIALHVDSEPFVLHRYVPFSPEGIDEILRVLDFVRTQLALLEEEKKSLEASP